VTDALNVQRKAIHGSRIHVLGVDPSLFGIDESLKKADALIAEGNSALDGSATALRRLNLWLLIWLKEKSERRHPCHCRAP